MGFIFEAKVYGLVTIDDKGQIIIPSELQKALNIRTGDQLIIFSEHELNSICLMPSKDLRKYLRCTSKFISKLKTKFMIKV